MSTTGATYAYDEIKSHTDHLNTPRLISDDQQRTVWRWDNTDPFGGNPPDENPSGLGAFEFPLRFPGQYADRETNLHYNYFRDYDPSLGRYAESDPVGLKAGLNTYGFVSGNPISITDPTGLISFGDFLFRGGAESGAKVAGRQAGARIGQQLCASGTPPDVRTICFALCQEEVMPPASGLASDFQEGCHIECVRAVSKCRAKPPTSGLSCPVPMS